MSDKKDFSKQRLSDFLAARLRARGNDEAQTQKSRRDSAKSSARSADKRTPPSPASCRGSDLSDIKTRRDRGFTTMSRSSSS
jgi:hypothetical protein